MIEITASIDVLLPERGGERRGETIASRWTFREATEDLYEKALQKIWQRLKSDPRICDGEVINMRIFRSDFNFHLPKPEGGQVV
jgi:hypothetical protein